MKVKKNMYKVKVIWMKNDYSWKKIERTVETKEQAEELANEVSSRLNKLVNRQFIKDYRVEY